MKEQRLLLRDIDEADLEMLFKWRNSARIRKHMFHNAMITKQEHYDWFKRIKQADHSLYKIFEYDLEPVGVISFTEIDFKVSICNWGFYLGKVLPERYVGLTMGICGLNYVFNQLNIKQVIGKALVQNKVSICFHKKLGFQETAYDSNCIVRNGIPEDVISFSLCKEEWKEKERLIKREEKAR